MTRFLAIGLKGPMSAGEFDEAQYLIDKIDFWKDAPLHLAHSSRKDRFTITTAWRIHYPLAISCPFRTSWVSGAQRALN